MTHQVNSVADANENPVDYAKGDPVAKRRPGPVDLFADPGTALGGQKMRVLGQPERFDLAHPSA